jgi:arabinofuranosyltransferase
VTPELSTHGPKRSAEQTPPRRWAGRLLLAALLMAALVVVLRSAWVCDDAYITFRVVRNFWGGHGLRWNLRDRVCAYTNPLMMFSMLAFYPITGEFFYTATFFGVFVSMLALAILALRAASTTAAAAVALLLLIASKTFVDYTTSGLENSLGYLLAAIFFFLAFRRDPRRDGTFLAMALVAGLASVNRMDMILLFLPALLYCWWKKRTGRRLGLLAAGFGPLIAWVAFSVIYYGRPLPNTAYAKLNTGLALGFYLGKGLAFYKNSLLSDPITLPIIAGAVVASIWARSGKCVSAAIGLVLYLLYVLRVGGDFMSGRFFAVPVFCAVLLWCVLPRRGPKGLWRVLGGAGVFGACLQAALHPLCPVFVTTEYNPRILPRLQDFEHTDGVADERAYYYKWNGLLMASRYRSMPAHFWRESGSRLRGRRGVLVVREVGMRGFFAGRGIHVLDACALGDPLLALAPVLRDRSQRIGHMERLVPHEYVVSLQAGENRFGDPKLRQLYAVLDRIHCGPIWSWDRWRDIWKLNTGQYGHLVDRALFEHPMAMGVRPVTVPRSGPAR